MLITFPWRGHWKLWTLKQKRCSSSRGSGQISLSLLLMSRVRREVSKTHCIGNQPGEQIKNMTDYQTHARLIQLFYLHWLCSYPMDSTDFMPQPHYLYLDIESTILQLNIDKGVWPWDTTPGPTKHSTRCHRNQACYEHNTTAAMATSGGVTSKPGSLGSSSKHDTCALKVKNIHRLNARYWTLAQRMFVHSDPSFSGGWATHFKICFERLKSRNTV